jgi:hypothetical protein
VTGCDNEYTTPSKRIVLDRKFLIGQIARTRPSQDWAITTPSSETVAFASVRTTTGHRIHVVQGPHERPLVGHRLKKRREVDQFSDPMKMNNVAIENLGIEWRLDRLARPDKSSTLPPTSSTVIIPQ